MTPIRVAFLASAAIAFGIPASAPLPAWAQDVAAASPDAGAAIGDVAPAGLTDDELTELVARIALYPDDLIALISAASLFPLQIVEAQRYLDTLKDTPDAKPKDTWDGSVISLLNYPEIVKMMSDDLEWTQNLGTALAYQQKDVLVAIQQLRDQAVANDVIESDEHITVVNEGENVIIQSANPETVYIPQYEPEMFYEEGYDDWAPISYYPDPYPYYYWPTAPYFAGFVTGAIWGAAMDWNDWGVWGGNVGSDFEINCRNCLNNIDGKIRAGDVDLRNVDRGDISFDRDQFSGGNRDAMRTNLKENGGNNVRTRAANVKREGAVATKRASQISDVRASAKRPEGARAGAGAGNRQGAAAAGGARKAAAAGGGARKAAAGGGSKKPTAKRQASKPKAATRSNSRPKKPSAMGEVRGGKKAQVHSSKGRQAMGGGNSGRSHKSVRSSGRSAAGGRGGGGRGGGGGGRGGGGRR